MMSQMWAWFKAIFLVMTRPLWCSASGIYRAYHFKRLDNQHK